jgi:hypothetical protein
MSSKRNIEARCGRMRPVRFGSAQVKVVECENKDTKKAWYAFQIDDERIVFVSAGFWRLSQRFPSSDFVLVDIAYEKGNIVAGYARSHGDRLLPIRTISEREARAMRSPDHMEIVRGDLTRIDTLLGVKA